MAARTFWDQITRPLAEADLVSDELAYDRPLQYSFVYDEMAPLDRRDSQGYEQVQMLLDGDRHVEHLDMVVASTSSAIYQILAYTPTAQKGDFLAQMYAFRGYAILQMAEDLCPGFPINDIGPDKLSIYSQPFTTDSAAQFAEVQLDSAIALGHDSVQYVNFARVVKGRSLLDRGLYSQAAQAVASVPDAFALEVDTTDRVGNAIAEGPIFDWGSSAGIATDQEGGNGLPFISAHDPRVVTRARQPRFNPPHDSVYEQLKYADRFTPIVLASGIEARLIEAEVALNANDPSWLAILNALRTTCTSVSSCASPAPAGTGGVAGLAPLADPGAPDAQVDVLYHERAFWLYLTGRRLGDMRRLVRNYHRDPQTVFPVGNYPLGTYGSATSIPFNFSIESRYNHHITTGCTVR